MQLALRPNSIGQDLQSCQSASASRVSKFLIAGVTVAGAAAIAVNPLAPNMTTHNVAAEIQARAVRLTSGISDVLGDYQNVFGQAGTNLQTLSGAAAALPATLQSIGTDLSGLATNAQAGVDLPTLIAAAAAIPGLLQAISANSSDANLISTGLSGAETGLQNALDGGWYGGDDGYIFGLFGGSVTHDGVTESGSTLQEVLTALQQGNTFDAFAYSEAWSLETIDHTLKPLLSPILNTAKAGATPTETIPGDILQSLTNLAATSSMPGAADALQALTNLTATFLSYSNLKALGDAVLSPDLSVAFGLVDGLSTVQADASSGNTAQAVTDVLKAPADLAGDLLNGYVLQNAQYNPTGAPFTGLLNKGSLLQDVLQTWPQQFATAVSPATATSNVQAAAATDATAEATSAKAAAATAAVTAGVDTAKDATPTVTTAKTETTTANARNAIFTGRGWGAKHAGGTTVADSSSSQRGTRHDDTSSTAAKDLGKAHGHGGRSASGRGK